MTRKKLPIGIQTFSHIREEGCYYVDKTPQILQMVEEGNYYFLSRPRRFGKSLLLDTIAELFAGNRGLFAGLAAETGWDWECKFPVIRISFADVHSREALDEWIDDVLRVNADALGLPHSTAADISGRFGELIRNAEHVHGQRVVVLVDDCDKPVFDNLAEPEVASAVHEGLLNLYSVIKAQDRHLRFAMLTGVYKFSTASMFSGLNSLNDITLDAKYSAICGYTDVDVDTVFAPELAGLDRDEIRQWYNGYNWTATSVYNPFDLLLLFQKRKFRNYWFETGTPTFLLDLLAERRTFTPQLAQVQVSEGLLSAFDVGDISTEALMFQTGYLTIARVQYLGVRQHFHLGHPNLEVRVSLNEALLQRWLPEPRLVMEQGSRLYELLLANDFTGLHALFTAFFASIPHDWYRNNPIAQYEGYYASIFYSHFAALGLDMRLEDVTNRGRIDMTVLFNGQVYLFEFKVVELVPEGRALQQIRERDYAEKYRSRGEPIHLIGVEFSRESRSVVGFEVEREG